jgi:hypothetical protein
MNTSVIIKRASALPQDRHARWHVIADSMPAIVRVSDRVVAAVYGSTCLYLPDDQTVQADNETLRDLARAWATAPCVVAATIEARLMADIGEGAVSPLAPGYAVDAALLRRLTALVCGRGRVTVHLVDVLDGRLVRVSGARSAFVMAAARTDARVEPLLTDDDLDDRVFDI